MGFTAFWKQLTTGNKYPDKAACTLTHRTEGFSDVMQATIDGGKYWEFEGKPVPYAEALKITYNADLTVANKLLLGGEEDCLDVVRTGRLHLHNCTMCADSVFKTRIYITAKGGGMLHVYEDIIFYGAPRWWSVSLGDWTLYNHNPDFPPMRKVVLRNVRRYDGKRFLILQLFCDEVVVENCPGATVINLSWFAPFWFKVLRKLRKKPPAAGVPIPYWLT